MLGAVVAAATGRPPAEYRAEKICGPAGIEASSYCMLNADGDQEPGGFGVSACPRDFGRSGAGTINPFVPREQVPSDRIAAWLSDEHEH